MEGIMHLPNWRIGSSNVKKVTEILFSWSSTYDFWPFFYLHRHWMHMRDNYGHILYCFLLLRLQKHFIEADNYDCTSGCNTGKQKERTLTFYYASFVIPSNCRTIMILLQTPPKIGNDISWSILKDDNVDIRYIIA